MPHHLVNYLICSKMAVPICMVHQTGDSIFFHDSYCWSYGYVVFVECRKETGSCKDLRNQLDTKVESLAA